ncbi:hypothetical protein LWI29_031637 [Acer saccharum]|uniref:phosphatidate cytidylyltransferase n=1 Tax=Acer saccharum TaxID=4024 RepID=A0AA39SNY9_ACESA|nr:hypothetical protein LWI29_031637 [Acer saccharum]
MWIRAYSAMWMLLGFLSILYLGHLYIWAMVVVIQIYMAKELFNLLRRAPEDRLLPGSRLLNWHFYFTAVLFVYGRILSQQLVNTVISDKFHHRILSAFIKYQMVICYFLYIAGFMWFILSLKKRSYKYQFSQYAWTHMILIVVFAQSSFLVANIFQGIFWFLLPASLIAINDVAAYFFGFFFGKTPLIKLSPKKTWEGFIGASVATVISAFVFANILGRFQWLTCPRKDLSTGWLQCDPGPLFKPEFHSFPGWIPEWSNQSFISLGSSLYPIQDFGDSIPGHGGVTDRNDCQMVMAVFAYIYHQSFVVPQSYSVEIIMDEVMRSLNLDQQQALHVKLGQILHQRQFGL